MCVMVVSDYLIVKDVVRITFVFAFDVPFDKTYEWIFYAFTSIICYFLMRLYMKRASCYTHFAPLKPIFYRLWNVIFQAIFSAKFQQRNKCKAYDGLHSFIHIRYSMNDKKIALFQPIKFNQYRFKTTFNISRESNNNQCWMRHKCLNHWFRNRTFNWSQSSTEIASFH